MHAHIRENSLFAGFLQKVMELCMCEECGKEEGWIHSSLSMVENSRVYEACFLLYIVQTQIRNIATVTKKG
jgi:hypothetical protein